MTAPILRPRDSADLEELIRAAATSVRRLAIRGGGSKDGIGVPEPDAALLDMRGFSGVIDYDPAELVLTAGAGTPLGDVQALLAANKQMLAFEPYDHGPLFGRAVGTATLGGVLAAAVAGSQRLTQGAARDHLLGFEAVSGRGERFIAGGRVVKNVTGYDLPKLAAGSWGRLFAMTQVTVKVMPAPREQRTLVAEGLDFPAAVGALSQVLGSAAEAAAAAYLPPMNGAPSRTVVRLQGFGSSVAARATMAERFLDGVRPCDPVEAAEIWQALATLSPLRDQPRLWRISVPPARSPQIVEALAPKRSDWLADWAGGLLWIGTDMAPSQLRAVAEREGGHAMLVRRGGGDDDVPVFHPRASLAPLEARVRRAFDPAGIFETGRFGDVQ